MNNVASSPGRRLSTGPGGAIYSENSSFVLSNCTFNGNTADGIGGALYSKSGFPILSNCIFWGDTPNQIQVEMDMPTVTYSNIEGGFPGEGNIDVDPLFANPETGDFHLKSQAGCCANCNERQPLFKKHALEIMLLYSGSILP
ncbi:MAG: DUF5123 domain-containing protein [Planctomycetes bacterium]|nr:DUF5123 domain-containing protein [Planctomycetota bacterium]